jgi:hypothetical protein
MDPASRRCSQRSSPSRSTTAIPHLTFEARLARDHSWPHVYANRVLVEYLRQSIESSGGCGAGCGGSCGG